MEAERTGQGFARPVATFFLGLSSPIVKISTFPDLRPWERPSHHHPSDLVIRAVSREPFLLLALTAPPFFFFRWASFFYFLVTPSPCCSCATHPCQCRVLRVPTTGSATASKILGGIFYL